MAEPLVDGAVIQNLHQQLSAVSQFATTPPTQLKEQLVASIVIVSLILYS